MGFHDLFNLRLILGLHSFHDSILVVLRLLFVMISTLLELFKSNFELALRFKQVTLIVVLLRLKEHHFAFPKSLISVVVALKILELTLRFLKLSLHFC